MIKRAALDIAGIVQGVGFRPYVYNLAGKLGLSGWVQNTSQGVLIEIEGEENFLEKFISTLRMEGPPLARIEGIRVSFVPPREEKEFRIVESRGGEVSTLVSPDTGVCPQCLAEMFDPKNRRYRYPFINCTNCGPRFTIIKQIPYDRKFTTMKEFPMCPECHAEYYRPSDRRFHAQPNACPVCGPKVFLKDRQGQLIAQGEEVWARTQEALCRGEILAVKGLGGYHLCCNALNGEAVSKLRCRKERWDKPFAVMMPDLDTVLGFCRVNSEEKELLKSRRRPIVLLEKKDQALLPEEIAPKNRRLGVMLPYTPLHYLLIQGFSALIMTSGNVSDEPIAYRDQDALARLSRIADLFLTHNREIFRRCDDSVVLINRGKMIPIRRSRGYAPEPVTVHFTLPNILACGGEQKNTFCLTKDHQAFLSHHIGDLENLSTLLSFEEGVEHFKAMFQIEPKIIACDLHPEYLSTKYARDYPGTVEIVEVQHHHAHIASCLADNSETGPVIGVSFDGTGLGTDGCIWGGEFLVCGYHNFIRAAHLKYLPMLSGAKAIREPWRMAASYLFASYGRKIEDLDIDFVKSLPKSWPVLRQALGKNINSPLTSSCGRLFDGVAALVGLRSQSNYEGQAAVELEQAIIPGETGSYSFEIIDAGGFSKEGIGKKGAISSSYSLEILAPQIWEIDWRPVIRGIVQDLGRGKPAGRIAGKFHHAVAEMILKTCCLIRKFYDINRVALSGGVFQNIYLLNTVENLLTGQGFRVFTHSRVPANDGGLSLGQAMIAACQIGDLGKENL